MSAEAKVTQHYTRGKLEDTILKALAQAGKDREHLTVTDLAGLDQFHVGGIDSTGHLAEQMAVCPGMRLLDVGSGIGGPARYFAAEQGCRVTGIDLTPEFVETAAVLTRLLKLDSAVEFRQASALVIPFEPHTFDGAYMIHVGMNIADKAGAFREVARVLKPGASFGVFDIMRSGAGSIRYPVPWAAHEDASFVARPEAYRTALEEAGLHVTSERGRRDFAIEATLRGMARMAESGPPVLGLQLLMGDQTRAMVANALAMMQEGLLEPVELIARLN